MLDASQICRPFVLGTIIASMAMIAIEATIISTAMPQIASQLGDLHLYSWVFSSFLLAQTALTVVFGKLADLYGRSPCRSSASQRFSSARFFADWHGPCHPSSSSG